MIARVDPPFLVPSSSVGGDHRRPDSLVPALGGGRERAFGTADRHDAPSFKATQRMGEAFNESNSGTVAVIVLEGQQPLGDDAHGYLRRFDSSVEATIRHMCSTFRISGAIRSPRAPRKAPTEKPLMCRSTSSVHRPGDGERIRQATPGHRRAHARAPRGPGLCHRPRGDRR